MKAFRKLSAPVRAHPLVRRLYEEMNYQQIGVLDLAGRSGINANTLKDWRTRTCPTVDNLNACLNVLGLELTVRKRVE